MWERYARLHNNINKSMCRCAMICLIKSLTKAMYYPIVWCQKCLLFLSISTTTAAIITCNQTTRLITCRASRHDSPRGKLWSTVCSDSSDGCRKMCRWHSWFTGLYCHLVAVCESCQAISVQSVLIRVCWFINLIYIISSEMRVHVAAKLF